MAAPPRRAALAFIFVVVLVDVLAFGVIIPVLSHLIEPFISGSVSKASWFAWRHAHRVADATAAAVAPSS